MTTKSCDSIGTRLRRCAIAVTSIAVIAASCFAPLVSCRAADSKTGPDAGSIQQARERALNYLRTSQSDDGSWTTKETVGITGLIVTAALRSGLKPDDPMVDKGLKALKSAIQPDGGIYVPKSRLQNYETCVALLAFHEADRDGRYDAAIADAEMFLRKQQWDEDDGKDKSDPTYGGWGYGSGTRPDLSNTQFLLDALQAAGAKSDDPAVRKALIFVSRSQNLETEANNSPLSTKVNDGGFFYTPAAQGASAAGKTDEGGLRSYGSMTYAGLKSMLYAGVGLDDPRVKAAITWIKKHYTVEENPSLDQNGLFYYYHTFAKALDTLGRNDIEADGGAKHDWRAELSQQLIKTQKANGSWVNSSPRWNEGDPNLATGFALLALSYCNPPAK